MTAYREPRLLCETEDFAVFYKPPGRETVSQTGGPDLASWAAETLGAPVYPAHRLDRDTSGVQLMAKSPAVEEGLTTLFRERKIAKHYLAVCRGKPANRAGNINRNLSKWEGGRRPVRVVKGGGGLVAATGYRVLAASGNFPEVGRLSLVVFSPHQGRTHQIRVHAAAFGYPVLGDDQYGDRPANKWARDAFGLERQALHSRSLEFIWNGERVFLDCPLPEDMAKVAAAAFPDFLDNPDIPHEGLETT